MKKNFVLLVFATLFFSLSAFAQSTPKEATTPKVKVKKQTISVAAKLQKETFTVHGNCNMCKRAIEGNVKLLEGINQAVWDKETDQMTVSFDSKVITLDAIKQKIADIGYDSDTHRATEEAYNKLPGCCQYDRPEMKVD